MIILVIVEFLKLKLTAVDYLSYLQWFTRSFLLFTMFIDNGKELNLTFLLVISYDENKTDKYVERGVWTHKN